MDYPIRLADQLKAHLRFMRKQRGLTQAQLGKRLGIGQVRIAEIEARPGLVSVDQLVKPLSALGASLVVRDLEGGSAAPVVGPMPGAGFDRARSCGPQEARWGRWQDTRHRAES